MKNLTKSFLKAVALSAAGIGAGYLTGLGARTLIDSIDSTVGKVIATIGAAGAIGVNAHLWMRFGENIAAEIVDAYLKAKEEKQISSITEE